MLILFINYKIVHSYLFVNLLKDSDENVSTLQAKFENKNMNKEKTSWFFEDCEVRPMRN